MSAGVSSWNNILKQKSKTQLLNFSFIAQFVYSY